MHLNIHKDIAFHIKRDRLLIKHTIQTCIVLQNLLLLLSATPIELLVTRKPLSGAAYR